MNNTKITLSQLERINFLIKKREKFLHLIKRFNTQYTLRLCEKTGEDTYRHSLEHSILYECAAKEIEQANELILNKLNIELQEIEKELKIFVDLNNI